uniref:Uncharacterized protein n=1 Tax=Caenorhabditis japonica TaxID=281687 RepID=A0A8R1E716_CAEJA
MASIASSISTIRCTLATYHIITHWCPIRHLFETSMYIILSNMPHRCFIYVHTSMYWLKNSRKPKNSQKYSQCLKCTTLMTYFTYKNNASNRSFQKIPISCNLGVIAPSTS